MNLGIFNVGRKSRVKLFLDDVRTPQEADKIYKASVLGCDPGGVYREKGWVVVRSYGEFVDYIRKNRMPYFISFDHDLGDVPNLKTKLDFDQWYNVHQNREYTGLDAAKWLADYCLTTRSRLPACCVHGANPAGRENIKSYLESFADNFPNIMPKIKKRKHVKVL